MRAKIRETQKAVREPTAVLQENCCSHAQITLRQVERDRRTEARPKEESCVFHQDYKVREIIEETIWKKSQWGPESRGFARERQS